MRIAVTGASGQLGQALQRVLAGVHEIIPLSHADLDLERPDCVQTLVATGAQCVIHPAAYTNVDGCARDPDRAYRVNALGTRYVALACQALDASLVYVSTNEVFNGAASSPYLEYDRPAPINPYGFSKWAGEQTVRELLRRFYIVRVAWLFGGERNFVRTVLRLASERSEIAMVVDEIGSPTYAPDAAAAIARLVENAILRDIPSSQRRVLFALRVCGSSAAMGRARDVTLRPMNLAEYQRASRVPPYTPLRNVAAAALGIRLRPWEEALAEYVGRLLHVERVRA